MQHLADKFGQSPGLVVAIIGGIGIIGAFIGMYLAKRQARRKQ